MEYYSEIYKYLYVEKFNLNISRFPEYINKIKNSTTRDNKKKNSEKNVINIIQMIIKNYAG